MGVLESKKNSKVEKGWVCWLEIIYDFESQGKKFNIGAADEKKYVQVLEQKNGWVM